jgi:UDP:flavonoid glycosyltransferase YjiC (YdhE family)
MSETDTEGHAAFRARFNEVIKPIHDDFNAIPRRLRRDAYPLGQFFEASPHLNLLLYPEQVKYKRARCR